MPWKVIGRDGNAYLLRHDSEQIKGSSVCRSLELDERLLSPPIPPVTAATANSYWEDFDGDPQPILDAMKTATLTMPGDTL